RRSGQPFTLRDAVRAMAKLGGFLGRKSDGEPGIKTLWRGYRQLQLICWGIQLASH
ncbi:MAG: IS4 family transposase, partial [Thermaerobacter sp.]|nr:IS4 family transposase [Thermaerobacter sp.]